MINKEYTTNKKESTNMNKFETALKEMYPEFVKFKEIICVYLFGSVARGDFSLKHSDLDIFIILNQPKPLKKTEDAITKIITTIGFQHGVKVQIEFQGLKVSDEDKSLLRKVMDEGRLIYSKGFITFDKYKIGLKTYMLYKYFNPNKDNRARFSQILHGYKSFYYAPLSNLKNKLDNIKLNNIKDKKIELKNKKINLENKRLISKDRVRITKEYKGIIDNKEIIEAGKGAIIVSKDKEQYIKRLFDEYGIEYKFEKMVYSE